MTDFNKQTGQQSVKPTSSGANFLEHGKLPPQAVELEEAVLGALMLEKEALNTIFSRYQRSATKLEVFIHKKNSYTIFVLFLKIIT